MIDLGIVWLKQFFQRHLLERIHADAALLFIQAQLHKIKPRGIVFAIFRSYPLQQPLVFGVVIVVFLLDPVSLFEVLGHFSCKLNVYKGRAVSFPADNGVYHLYRLGNCPASYRTCYILIIFLCRVKQFRFFAHIMAFEVDSCSGTGLVVVHTLLKKRNKHIARLYGYVPEFRKASDRICTVYINFIESCVCQILSYLVRSFV